jgi:hypothetical protein
VSAPLRCLSCGSDLAQAGYRRAKCTNPRCTLGSTLYQCEFCETYAVTRQVQGLTCHNPDCRVYDMLRKGCHACDKVSLVAYRGMEVCLNRRCSTNAKRLRNCIFCRRPALLSLSDYSICIKGHCSHFLVPLVRCFFCKAITFNIEKKTCENPACKMNGVRVDLCPFCNTRARTVVPGEGGLGRCLNPSCKRKQAEGPSRELPDEMPSGTLVLADEVLQELDKIMGSARQRQAKGAAGTPGSARAARAGAEPAGSFRTARERPATPAAAPPAPRPPAAASPIDDLAPLPAPPPPARATTDRFAGGPSGGQLDGDSGLVRPTDFVDTVSAAAPPPVGGPGLRDSEATVPMPPPSAAAPRSDPETVRTGGAGAGSMSSPILETFEFVKEKLLTEAGGTAPVYMVIGTAGAGKTTYLCMLGEILRCRESKYHFPYQGMDVRRIQVEKLAGAGGARGARLEVYKNHIKDLVFDFAQKEYSGSISKMHWPEQTPSDEKSSFFLVTELTRQQKTVARIVTFETSGEDFQAALKGITEYDPSKVTDNPLHQMIYELMDLAEGFVVLMPPEGRANDDIYKDFFLAIREGLEPRALNHLSAVVQTRLGKGASGGAKDTDKEAAEAGLTQMIQMVRLGELLDRRKTEDRQRFRKEWSDSLRQIRYRLKQGDLNAIDGPEGQCMKEAEKVVLEMGAEGVQRARNALREKGITKDRIISYYVGLLDYVERELDNILDKLPPPRGAATAEGEGGQEGISKEEFDRALWEIRGEYGLSEGFALEFSPDTFGRGEVRRFRHLKHLAVVFTKTDMYPAVYPPENYPSRNLPGCKIHIDVVEDYLRLLSGSIRYYNASATGYSLLRDTLYVPGPENTFTPINVVEPIFDMLGIQ